MYECFHCGEKAVIWDSDFDYDDYGIDGDGLVHVLHCANCGATITYEVGDDGSEGEEVSEDSVRVIDVCCGAGIRNQGSTKAVVNT